MSLWMLISIDKAIILIEFKQGINQRKTVRPRIKTYNYLCIMIRFTQRLELSRSILHQLQYPLPRIMPTKQLVNKHESPKHEKKRQNGCFRMRQQANHIQLLTVFHGVFNGSNGIDESPESSDGSVDLENTSSHCLRGRGARRRPDSSTRSLGPTLDILKTHARFSVMASQTLKKPSVPN